jgi:hypothetical protein
MNQRGGTGQKGMKLFSELFFRARKQANINLASYYM